MNAWRGPAWGLMLLAIAAAGSLAFAQSAPKPPAGFTVNQAIGGKAAYDEHCASCHGADLMGSGPAGALRGSRVLSRWADWSPARLFAAIRRMPPGQADSLPPATSAAIMAYLLQSNGIGSGPHSLPSSEAALAELTMPLPGAAAGGPPRAILVIPPRSSSRLNRLRAVTAAELAAPPPEDWLHWRRTYDAHGFSPLTQIDAANVGELQLAWSWSLPRGDNMMPPIVRDGVLYAYSFGDVVEALDAATGELLWRYERRLTPGASFQGKKGVAIAGDRILVPTSDMHVLALAARTGEVLWDHAIDTGGQVDFQIKSAPLVAAGKVVIGVNGFTTRGGNFIVALDLETGREAWRFHTVARPGQPGGDSWNGQPVEARTGGSVWVAGSYDPALNLLYFGAAPTYNPAPLRAARPGFTNEALYTNSTVALDPATGRLVWHFQHQANDQFDHDWAFEQQIVELRRSGKTQKLVMTGGKAAVFDLNDAATGAYRYSIDMGLQNVIAAIDPATGAKTLDPRALVEPGQVLQRGGVRGVCPDLLGARNLMSTAYDAHRGVLFAPLMDTCIQPWPNGVRWQKRPDPATDGQFGLLQAVDVAERRILWKARETAAPVSGVLATAGGLVFVGDADRWFRAYDARGGAMLWRTRLDNAPASYPVSYAVEGRQYVAVATNSGFVHVQAMQQAGKIAPPPNGGATLWVFALKDAP